MRQESRQESYELSYENAESYKVPTIRVYFRWDPESEMEADSVGLREALDEIKVFNTWGNGYTDRLYMIYVPTDKLEAVLDAMEDNGYAVVFATEKTKYNYKIR